MSGMLRRIGGAGGGLNEVQETALAALREGETFVAAAKRAGVGRATLYRWVQSDPHFQAAYNLWQRELAESARARLLKLTDKAVEVLEKALARGDEQVALQMLRHTGVMRRQRARSTDVEVLDLKNQLKRRREHRRVASGMLDIMLGNMGIPPKQRRRIIKGQDGGEFMRQLDQHRAAAGKPQEQTHGETPARQAPATPADALAASETRMEDNSFPEQPMQSETPWPHLKLAGETAGETPQALSHDPGPEPKPQMIEGWRVGTKLHAVP